MSSKSRSYYTPHSKGNGPQRDKRALRVENFKISKNISEKNKTNPMEKTVVIFVNCVH